ncbi:hypothetical protein DSO57_1029923 [Entomophthora muscae]|uniref:Uncharacterized protein n=1 Tax=Entomophthora muscae TaxID=34485 RepID=A0ACC2RS20_9FUNG|nr:hypothetical protein DSO57_1029923 [Entomophthora muscae]
MTTYVVIIKQPFSRLCTTYIPPSCSYKFFDATLNACPDVDLLWRHQCRVYSPELRSSARFRLLQSCLRLCANRTFVMSDLTTITPSSLIMCLQDACSTQLYL